ncbi:MAG: biotin/lipoyl-binding protein, partial [Tagaea sp.]
MSSAVKALPPPERFSGARIAPPAGGAIFVVAIAALVGSLGFWASLGTLDTYASGQGRVVPSLQIQRIQNLEGGILSQLLVADGDRVAEGQILARIDDVAFASEFQQNRQKYLSLLAAFARLEAESA